MFAPGQLLTVSLRAEQWNQVLALLADGPYRVVNPLLQEMQRQLLSHEQKGEGAVLPWPREAPPPAEPKPESA